jgi:hypothetical protein
MNAPATPKKLFRIALYTSTAIGLITVGPAYIIGITMGNISMSGPVMLKLLAASVFGISCFVFIIWLINIAILNYFNNRSFVAENTRHRYLWSFLVCLGLMFSLRLSLTPLMNDPERVQRMLNWKIKEFGLQIGNMDYTQYTNPIFQTAIIFFTVVSINAIVLIILDLVLLRDKKTKIESENIRLKMKNIEAANQKLKQQLQPHFLFNSLNVLKALIRKQPDGAEAYIKRLSDFLRASVSFDNVNTVKFEEELKLSLDYMEMQKIRFDTAVRFEVSIPEAAKAGFLPIFSIQLLLENAIKHNAFTIESPLYIKLFYSDGRITVSNNVRQKTAEESSSGMGLSNLSERYKLLSGDDIRIQSTDSDFSVSIKILTDENCNH